LPLSQSAAIPKLKLVENERLSFDTVSVLQFDSLSLWERAGERA
jgi:hypothetical protein